MRARNPSQQIMSENTFSGDLNKLFQAKDRKNKWRINEQKIMEIIVWELKNENDTQIVFRGYHFKKTSAVNYWTSAIYLVLLVFSLVMLSHQTFIASTFPSILRYDFLLEYITLQSQMLSGNFLSFISSLPSH